MRTNMQRLCWSFILGALGAMLAAGAFGEAFISEDGQSRAEIVISERPLRMTKLAAEELRTYIEKISGARLPIATSSSGNVPVQIYVGKSAHTDRLKVFGDDLKHGGFRMVSGENWLVLLGHDSDFEPMELHARRVADRARIREAFDVRTGATWLDSVGPYMDRSHHAETGWWKGDERGSLNAVYEFLRSLGVRWYMPGELGEVVPKAGTVKLPQVNKVVRPDFGLRHHDLNRFDLVSREDILWHFRLGLNHGADFYGYGGRHGINMVIGRDETKQAHPEYYALWDGKRQTDYGKYGAPCLSAEGLFEENVRFVRAVFDIYDEPAVDVSVTDNLGKSGTRCECEACQAQYTLDRPFGGISDYVWSYVNRVAQEVYKTHPDKKILSYAYQNHLLPPEKIDKLSPNLVVGIAAVWRHKRHHPELNPPAKRDLDKIRCAWQEKVTSGQMFVWDYYLSSQVHRGGLANVPVYFPHAISEDLRAVKAVPAMQGEFIEVTRCDPKLPLPEGATPWGTRGSLYAPGFNHLNLYVTARLYWDVDQDVDAMLEEYYDLFYGPARSEMRAFVDFCEKNWPQMTDRYERKDPAIIRQMNELLAAARKAAGGSVYGKRIDLMIEYTRPVKQETGEKQSQ